MKSINTPVKIENEIENVCMQNNYSIIQPHVLFNNETASFIYKIIRNDAKRPSVNMLLDLDKYTHIGVVDLLFFRAFRSIIDNIPSVESERFKIIVNG